MAQVRPRRKSLFCKVAQQIAIVTPTNVPFVPSDRGLNPGLLFGAGCTDSLFAVGATWPGSGHKSVAYAVTVANKYPANWVPRPVYIISFRLGLIVNLLFIAFSNVLITYLDSIVCLLNLYATITLV